MKIVESYRSYTARRITFGALLLLLLILGLVFALSVGSYSSPVGFIKAAVNEGSKATLVLWNIRLPRIIAATTVGAGLAVAGAVMQCLLKNPLASPFTMGISHPLHHGNLPWGNVRSLSGHSAYWCWRC